MIVVTSIGLALANALGYYVWDIVKSAYKEVQEENHQVFQSAPYEMTSRTTYEQKPPAYQDPV